MDSKVKNIEAQSFSKCSYQKKRVIYYSCFFARIRNFLLGKNRDWFVSLQKLEMNRFSVEQICGDFFKNIAWFTAKRNRNGTIQFFPIH